MLCKIDYYSEAEFDEENVLQTQEELLEGEELFITQGHTMKMENIVINNDRITILDGEKMLILKVL